MSRIVCVSGRVQPNERDSRDPVTLGIRAALEQRGGWLHHQQPRRTPPRAQDRARRGHLPDNPASA